MYELQNMDDVAVLQLHGELSHGEMLYLESVLRRLRESSRFKVVLNFQDVDHVNYKTILHLVEGVRKFRELDGDVKLASANHYMKDIFRFTGVDQNLESYESVYDAVMSFNGVSESYRSWH